MVGTNIHEFTKVRAARAKCPTLSVPVACLIVASGSIMAKRLRSAATVTAARMMVADSSSSMYLEQISSAVNRVIHAYISTRNSATPQFQQTNTRLKVDHWSGRKKKIAHP